MNFFLKLWLVIKMALTSDKSKTAYNSNYPIDKILKTYTGNFVAAAGSAGAARGTLQFLETLEGYTPDGYFAQMIWTDDGVNWFPGGNPHNTLSAFNNNGQELTVIPVIGSQSIYVYALNQRPNSPTIQYKIAVYDRTA